MPFLTLGRGRIEYERSAADVPSSRTIVMLHEGLGSVSLWKDFPEQLARATRCNVIAYSRHGYGKSAPVKESRTVRYMHDEALIVLPQFLDALEIDKPILFGHSDGGSIALLYAASSPDALQGAIVLAPHILVEDVSVASIRQAREAYLNTDLRQRLARYHDDANSAFWGWNDIWLAPGFRDWSIEDEIAAIRCPLLAIQGVDDEYGTLEQVRGIARRVPQTRLLELPQCGHSPHKDQPQQVIAAVASFMQARP